MTTMLFRSAREDDLDAIHDLAVKSGVVGMTTLPKDINLLKKRLAWSTASFNKTLNSPDNEYYLFVLEDPDSGKVVGTSGIESAIGHDAPFYSYKLSKRTRVCHELNIRNQYDVLSLVNDNQGHSEICTLFLNPTYRHHGNGPFLSKARFVFIAQFRQRFSPTIIAEMRGIYDEEGRSPFWNQIGCHFFKMSYEEADRLTLSTNKQFIADLMPRSSIYVKLLAPDAQAVIGKPHPSTVPAMKILLQEGFHYNNYVDIFDAGPTLEAPRDQIHTISTSKIMTIRNIGDEALGNRFILANTKLDFRATVGHVIFNEQDHFCMISQEAAHLLQVKSGDDIRIAPLQI